MRQLGEQDWTNEKSGVELFYYYFLRGRLPCRPLPYLFLIDLNPSESTESSAKSNKGGSCYVVQLLYTLVMLLSGSLYALQHFSGRREFGGCFCRPMFSR